jgi:F-type H+-transporting ATPase subunit b
LSHRLRSIASALFLAVSLSLFAGAIAVAQENSSAPAAPAAASEGHGSGEDSGGEHNEFRHSSKVQWIARMFHVDTETAAQIFEDVNSAILILAILFFVMKVLPKAIRNRTATIQKQLVEARSATEIADERLRAVEAKLARLGEDIDKIRAQTEHDALEDEKRIKQSLEDERVRIVKAAEQEIESAGAAGPRRVKRVAAGLAIDRAAARIQLDAESDKAIIERFGKDLVGQFGKGGRN